MKISLSNFGKTFTVELEQDSSLDTCLDAIKGLLVSSGFHPTTVDWYIKTDTWNLEQSPFDDE
jgi:hypothetical protein